MRPGSVEGVKLREHMTETSPLDPLPQQVVLAYIDEPPFGRLGPDAKGTGCDVELARFVLREIGIKDVVTHLTTFAELLPGVAAGRWALNVPLFVTPERAAMVSFSRPVWALQDGFIVRAGNPKGLDSYDALAAVDGARLGVVTGQVQHEAALRAGVPSTRISLFSTQEAVVQALVAGSIDAYASTALGNRVFLRALNNPALLAVDLVNSASLPPATIPVGAFSFARENTALRHRFDAYLAHYLGSPGHRELMARHGLSAREIDPIVGFEERRP